MSRISRKRNARSIVRDHRHDIARLSVPPRSIAIIRTRIEDGLTFRPDSIWVDADRPSSFVLYYLLFDQTNQLSSSDPIPCEAFAEVMTIKFDGVRDEIVAIVENITAEPERFSLRLTGRAELEIAAVRS